MCHTLFSDFQDERSKVKVTWVIRSFCIVYSVASSLFHQITSYMAYVQKMRGTPFFCHLSTLWLYAYVTDLYQLVGVVQQILDPLRYACSQFFWE